MASSAAFGYGLALAMVSLMDLQTLRKNSKERKRVGVKNSLTELI
jgi:hypothetical protein